MHERIAQALGKAHVEGMEAIVRYLRNVPSEDDVSLARENLAPELIAYMRKIGRKEMNA